MSHFCEMEWNTKCDWENIISFGSKAKATEIPKKQQLTDGMIVDAGEINPGPYNLSRSGGYNSGSDGPHNSSAKSSILASEGCCGVFNKKMETEGTESSGNLSLMEASSRDSSIGLKLGKRTYFENTIKSTSFTVMPTLSSTTPKKNKLSAQSGPICCQVEGCSIDLSQAKEYHRKHRVCDSHSKCPKVIIRGLERRFCQQCSRFHSLCEFDEKKRSCRGRLSDHNARRRKPQQETIQINSASLSSLFYDGAQQTGFLLNDYSPDNTCNPKFTMSKGYHSKSNVDGSTYQRLHTLGIKSPHVMSFQSGTNGLWPSKNSMSDSLNPGSNGSLICPLDAAPDRALSLLSSSNFWDSCEPDSIPLHHVTHEKDNNFIHPMIHAIPEVRVPLSSSEFCPQPLVTNSNFQEFQLYRTSSYEAGFYSNILN